MSSGYSPNCPAFWDGRWEALVPLRTAFGYRVRMSDKSSGRGIGMRRKEACEAIQKGKGSTVLP